MTVRPSWYLTQTITVIKRRDSGSVDARGNTVYTETPVQVPNCLYDAKPINSLLYARHVEDTDRQEHVTDFGLLIFEDPNVDVEPTDQVILDSGPRFNIAGPIERYTGTRMGIDYAEVIVKRVKG